MDRAPIYIYINQAIGNFRLLTNGTVIYILNVIMLFNAVIPYGTVI